MALKREDLTGQKFGELTVLEYVGNGKYLCECSCENKTRKIIGGSHLKGGYTKTCGHKNGSTALKNMVGLEVGNFIVESYAGNSHWNCKCKTCGSIKVQRGWELRKGKIGHCEVCGADPRRDKLEGTTIGYLQINKYLGHKKYSTTCLLCGNDYEMFTENIKNSKYKCCERCANTNLKVNDLTGQTFGHLTVKYYIPGEGWYCECDCGGNEIIDAYKLTSGKKHCCSECWTHPSLINLTGQTINNFKVLNYLGGGNWLCECLKCGNILSVIGYNLRHGHSKSCCGNFKDLTGQTINEWTVKQYIDKSTWLCECSCGTKSYISGWELSSGTAKSCGCKKWKYTRNTLLQRYGEIAPCKIDNARDLDLIYTVEDKDKLIKFIETQFNHKPTTRELADKLNLEIAQTLRIIHKFGIERCIDVYCSKQENEVYKVIQDLIPDCNISRRDKSILSGNRELDIYIPEKKIAIEFNGSYWHSELNKPKKYHQDKNIECDDKGIQLIHIFEHEWDDIYTRNKLITMINNLLTNNQLKVAARHTEIKEIDNFTAREFLHKYHLQNEAHSSINLGCLYQNELIGVMTFGTPRFNTSYQYELIRLCWRPDTKVTGGSAKLFNYFLDKYNPASIISYCDISKFNGTVYKKLGFSLSHISDPSYIWYNLSNKDVVTRYQAQKHKLIAAGLGTEDETEDDIMHNLGYYKVYNSGNKVFIYEKEY